MEKHLHYVYMKKDLSITFLGTGSALGVPQVGCKCAVCLSPLAANKRLRTCILIRKNNKNFIIDPGPDLRQQLLKHPVSRIDGVLITHAHHDHIGGYDDLRILAIKQEGVIPTLIHEKNVDELKRRCGYLFKPGYTFFSLELLSDTQGVGAFEDLNYRYFTYTQNGMNVTGFVIEDTAFVSDIQTIDETLIFQLQGVKTLIVSIVMKNSGPFKSHLNLDEIKELKSLTGATQVIITHMGHDVDYDALCQNIDEDYIVSYDGFTCEV